MHYIPTNSNVSVKTSPQYSQNIGDSKIDNLNKRNSETINRAEQTIIRAGSISPIHRNIL